MSRSAAFVALVMIAVVFIRFRDATAGASLPVATTDGDVAAQLKDLQDQVAALRTRHDTPCPQIAMVGTATWTRPDILENRTGVRVALPPDIARQLGEDYVVILTNRFPKDGYPYLATYWTPADNGFEIRLVEPTLPQGGKISYASANRNYLVDWIVVKK